MDVSEILSETLRAVEAAKIPEHLQSVAFSKAFDYISGGATPKSQPTATEPRPGANRTASNGNATDRIAKFLGVDTHIVERVFAELNGEIKILVPVGSIRSSKTKGTQQLALLVAAGHQGAGIEESTSTDVIQEIAEEYKKYDPGNFSRHIRAMKAQFLAPGCGPIKTVKLSRQGIAEAAELVKLLGSENG